MKYSLLNHTCIPDTSGNCYPSILKAESFTNGIGSVWVFKDPASGILNGIFDTPKDFSAATMTLKIVWTANATSGNCDWNFRYKAITGDDTTSLDVDVSSSSDEALTNQTDAAPGAAKRRLEKSLSLTASYWNSSRAILWQLWRDGADGSNDTMSGNALLIDLLLSDA